MSKTRHEKRVRPKNDPYKRVKSQNQSFDFDDDEELGFYESEELQEFSEDANYTDTKEE